VAVAASASLLYGEEPSLDSLAVHPSSSAPGHRGAEDEEVDDAAYGQLYQDGQFAQELDGFVQRAHLESRLAAQMGDEEFLQYQRDRDYEDQQQSGPRELKVSADRAVLTFRFSEEVESQWHLLVNDIENYMSSEQRVNLAKAQEQFKTHPFQREAESDNIGGLKAQIKALSHEYMRAQREEFGAYEMHNALISVLQEFQRHATGLAEEAAQRIGLQKHQIRELRDDVKYGSVCLQVHQPLLRKLEVGLYALSLFGFIIHSAHDLILNRPSKAKSPLHNKLRHTTRAKHWVWLHRWPTPRAKEKSCTRP
jgi:hypothetical protein